MGEAPLAACLIALSRLAPAGRTGELCATAGAVDLSSITTAADQDLVSTTFTDEEAASVLGGRLATTAATWTQIPFGAIMPRQSCPARCRARRRVNCQVRSAPRLLPSSAEILTPTSWRCQRSAKPPLAAATAMMGHAFRAACRTTSGVGNSPAGQRIDPPAQENRSFPSRPPSPDQLPSRPRREGRDFGRASPPFVTPLPASLNRSRRRRIEALPGRHSHPREELQRAARHWSYSEQRIAVSAWHSVAHPCPQRCRCRGLML